MPILTLDINSPLLVPNQNDLFSFFPHGAQRCFCIAQVPPHKVRGGHRHQMTRMALSAASGSIKIYTQTPETEQIFELNQTNEWLLLGPHVWRMMYAFSPGAVLTVLASRPFHLTSYIDELYQPILLEDASCAYQIHSTSYTQMVRRK